MKLLKVLITDGGYLKSLVFIRALADYPDIELHVSSERNFVAGFYSRYCKHKTVNVSARLYPAMFIKKLVEYVKKNQIDVLIPILEDEIVEVLKHRDLFPKSLVIPLVDYKLLRFVNDKWNFHKLVEGLNILTPKTVMVNDLSELDTIKFRYPAIVKVRVSAGSKGVMKVNDKSELIRAFKTFVKGYNLDEKMYPLIQEYIEGGEYYCASAFCKHGEIKSVFVYKILRQYPLEHGTSTSRISIRDKVIEGYVKKILTKLGWHGIAQFDMIKKDGKLYFLEMNPRLYASISVTINSGLNYPYYLCRINDDIPIPKDYRVGVVSRVFLADTLVLFKSLLGKRRYPLNEYLAFGKNVYFDDIVLSDPMPSIPLFVKFLRGKLI